MSHLTDRIVRDGVADLAFPRLRVSDMQASLQFYTEKLGFQASLRYGDPPYYVIVDRDQASIGLLAGEPGEGSTPDNCFVGLENVKALYEQCRRAGVRIVEPLHEEAWESPEFTIADPDGNLVHIGA